MRRYKFLEKVEVEEALNQLRNAFLAAKNGLEVEQIIRAVLTADERLKIGRRVIIARMLNEGEKYEEIAQVLKTSRATINAVFRQMDRYPEGFRLIDQREEKVRGKMKEKIKIGGSLKVFKTTRPKYARRGEVER